MRRTGTLAAMLAAAVIWAAPVPRQALALEPGDPWVIGRIQGAHQPLPGFFHDSPRIWMQQIDDVEFAGFRLRSDGDSRDYAIRPNRDGFFMQKLPPGQYTLVRVRTDRPGFREDKLMPILPFTVPPASLVNLGTVNLVLLGPPSEHLVMGSFHATGTYLYRYRYERDASGTAYGEPLDWFRSRKAKVMVQLEGNVADVQRSPVEGEDSSEVVLRQRTDDRHP
ncbi:MAG: hypothetical protein JSV00_09275 [bacterium]|nr:MAG: hypothetical protein JSV00_09275 [bacterium]